MFSGLADYRKSLVDKNELKRKSWKICGEISPDYRFGTALSVEQNALNRLQILKKRKKNKRFDVKGVQVVRKTIKSDNNLLKINQMIIWKSVHCLLCNFILVMTDFCSSKWSESLINKWNFCHSLCLKGRDTRANRQIECCKCDLWTSELIQQFKIKQ